MKHHMKSLVCRFFLFYLSFSGLVIPGDADQVFDSISPQRKKNINDYKERFKKYPSYIGKFPNNPSDDQIVEFSRTLSNLKGIREYYPELIPEVDLYFNQIQSKLLATPGHAEAFERFYLKVKDAALNKKTHWGTVWQASQDLAVLRYLPSPETMRVLGRMMEDTKGATLEEKYPGQNEDYIGYASSAAEWAVVSLDQIGIEDPPVPGDHSYNDTIGNAWDYLPAWQTWWQEVKEGKRTYKFKGSDVAYDFNGPVKTFKKESSSTQTSERNPVSSDRTVRRDALIMEKEPVSESRGPIIWTIAAVGALLIGMWRLWTAKKKTV